MVGARDAKRESAAAIGEKDSETAKGEAQDLSQRIRNLSAALQPLGPVTNSTAYALAGQGLLSSEQEDTAAQVLVSRADDALAMARQLQELKVLEEALLESPLPNMEETAAATRELRPTTLQQEQEVLASEKRLQQFMQTYSAAMEAISSKFVELDVRLRRLEAPAPA